VFIVVVVYLVVDSVRSPETFGYTLVEDKIRMDLREIGWEGVNWIHLAQDKDQRWAAVNTVKNHQVLQKEGNFLTS
jgi:hypothetical protein